MIVKVLKDITAFRDEIAQHELEHILKAADANVSVNDKNGTKPHLKTESLVIYQVIEMVIQPGLSSMEYVKNDTFLLLTIAIKNKKVKHENK